MAEFFNDEQRGSYLAALAREGEGYKVRLERAEDDDEKLSVKRLQKRIAAVEAEIERVSKGGSVEETVPLADTEKPLAKMKLAELVEVALEAGIDDADERFKGAKKADVVDAISEAQARKEGVNDGD